MNTPDQSKPFDIDPEGEPRAGPEPSDQPAPEKPKLPGEVMIEKTFSAFEHALREAVLTQAEVEILFHGLDKGIEGNDRVQPDVAAVLREIKRKLKFIITHFKDNYGQE